jgi:hypothetical protein
MGDDLHINEQTNIFIETPLISVVKEQSNMLDYEIYYFVGALSLTIL